MRNAEQHCGEYQTPSSQQLARLMMAYVDVSSPECTAKSIETIANKFFVPGNNLCHSVQNLLSSRLLSININIRIYKNIILPVVLYGCETWSLTLREEHRLRVSENKVQKRVFEPKRDEVIGGWRKLLNGELFVKYNRKDQVKEDEMGRAYGTNGEKRNVYRILVGFDLI
jgi:hypothetical protein